MLTSSRHISNTRILSESVEDFSEAKLVSFIIVMAENSTLPADCGPLETMSRSLTESITAIHNFEVTNFSFLDGMGLDKYTSSSIFSVAGYDWAVRLHHKVGKGADVKFCVGGQTFHAHRCVLAARFPVFDAELFGTMKEKVEQCIKIEDMEPSIFEELLHFIYTDSLPGSGIEVDAMAVQHLLVAADRYGLDRLRLICEQKLCKRIDMGTVAITLALAEQHHCQQLREACIGFMVSSRLLSAIMGHGN